MTENPTQPQAQDQVRPQDPTTDDDRLDAVQDRIHDAKAAAADLHDADVVGDLGGAPGTGEDGHGSFEPSGAGENPVEGAAAGTPGEPGDADEPGPNPA